ncbi:MAG: hypothetical protein HZA78_02995 [Candidatus Schekmanbacteria bacterium]|nr:hypothetical protein [Candidatus Schekmanbacteria bacterium]
MNSFFIAGIMQGSLTENEMHRQDYRQKIKQIILKHFPQAQVICPYEDNPNSLEYDDGYGWEVFQDILKQAAQVDVLIAYLPEASMGTSLEMWEAYKNGVGIWSITPLTKNWVVKFLSQKILASYQELDEHLAQVKARA